jgi:5-hydroxyisourate hydrolase-like protein (transthyretin family)
MKPKILLLGIIFITSCLQSKASAIEIGDPGKSISEVTGNIMDADSKKPLKEVTVTAYLINKKEKLVLSDEWGHFDFDELKSGIYKLVFEKEGYHKVVKEKVVVKTDETFQLRIEMIENEEFDLLPSPSHFFKTK